MSDSPKPIRVRFAPSPTGYLHVGGARTALYNFLFAKKMQGSFVLRVEDTDLVRSTDASLKMVIEDLQWLGLNWDEGPDPVTLEDRGEYGPYRQSRRLPIYQKWAQVLLEQGLAYYCFLTDEELEAQRNQKLEQGLSPHVDSPYKDWSLEQGLAEKAKGKKAVVRFKTSHLKKDYTFKDIVRGEITFPSDMVGDFVLLRSDNMPVYNFCNVIDDHLMKISHVLRAEEHLPNTLRQLMLYEAFQWPVPEFGHLSLILDEDRKKLSKRKGATSCHEFKNEGYLPEALNNFIALLGWSHPEGLEILSVPKMAQDFSLDRLNPVGAIFDPIKLKWMNSQYIKELPLGDLVRYVRDHFKKEKVSLPLSDKQWENLIQNVRFSFETIQEAAESLYILDSRFFKIDPEASEVQKWETTARIWQLWEKQLQAHQAEYVSETEFLAWQDQIKQEVKVKGMQLFMPLRVAIIGKPHGKELKLIVPFISKKDLLERVQILLRGQNV